MPRLLPVLLFTVALLGLAYAVATLPPPPGWRVAAADLRGVR